MRTRKSRARAGPQRGLCGLIFSGIMPWRSAVECSVSTGWEVDTCSGTMEACVVRRANIRDMHCRTTHSCGEMYVGLEERAARQREKVSTVMRCAVRSSSWKVYCMRTTAMQRGWRRPDMSCVQRGPLPHISACGPTVWVMLTHTCMLSGCRYNKV
jgi:hypothetical protein